MIDTLKITSKQVKLCKDIMDYFAAKATAKDAKDLTEEIKERWSRGLYRRIELREAHKVLTSHVACPYFLTKNHKAKAAQKEGAGLYNVQRFIDHATKYPPKEVVETSKEGDGETPAPAKKKVVKKAKKEAAPKKDSKSKKGTKKETTPTEPEVTDQPVPAEEVVPAE